MKTLNNQTTIFLHNIISSGYILQAGYLSWHGTLAILAPMIITEIVISPWAEGSRDQIRGWFSSIKWFPIMTYQPAWVTSNLCTKTISAISAADCPFSKIRGGGDNMRVYGSMIRRMQSILMTHNVWYDPQITEMTYVNYIFGRSKAACGSLNVWFPLACISSLMW